MIKLKISRVNLNRADYKPNELFFPALPMCSPFALATGKKTVERGGEDVWMPSGTCGPEVGGPVYRYVTTSGPAQPTRLRFQNGGPVSISLQRPVARVAIIRKEKKGGNASESVPYTLTEHARIRVSRVPPAVVW